MSFDLYGAGTLALCRPEWRADARCPPFELHRKALTPMAREEPAWYSKLLRLLRRRGDNKPDAEDRLHDAWIRMAEYEQNHEVERPEAFVRKVALNLLIDERRSRSTRGEVVELDEEVLASASPSVEQVLMDREQLQQVAGAFLDADEGIWQVVVDSKVFGLTYEEIARKHGLSVSTVERRIYKATVLASKWKKSRMP